MPEKIFKQLNQKTQYPELDRFSAFENTWYIINYIEPVSSDWK